MGDGILGKLYLWEDVVALYILSIHYSFLSPIKQ
jgi:hypothetical protein